MIAGGDSRCATCSHQSGERFILPDGGGSSQILLVGDSPWKDEVASGKPFSGAAGRLLDRILSLMPGGGLRRADLTIANTIWCRPPHLGWMDRPFPEAVKAIEHCRPHLDQLIQERKPRAIVPMGNVALRRVCGVSGIEENAGYVLSSAYGTPCIPTFHPSYLQRGKLNLIPVVLWALTRATQIAQGVFKPTTYDLLIDPHPDALRSYVASAGARIGTLFIDIETHESSSLDEEDLEEKGASYTIIRAGFSIRKGTACSFPWVEPYISIMREALERADEVVEHADNHYDTKRLRAAGMPVPHRIVSSMWAWHWLQSDLPKGLGKIAPFWYAGPPWKHLNIAEPGYYNALDNAIGMDCYIGTREALVAQGRWAAFEKHCIDTDPILADMGRKGLCIDRAYQTAFMAQLEAERDVEDVKIQALVPDSIKLIKRWKRPPKDMVGVMEISVPIAVPLDTSIQALVDGIEPKKRKILPYRYQRRLPFNQNSWQQIQTLAAHLGIKLPKRESIKESDEEALATDQKTLKKYVKQYPVFGHILEYRKRDKLLSTYRWKLDINDRVHYQLSFWPSTWRLGCRAYNLQTIPKRSDLAKSFRRMIVASPGCKLVEGDAAAIEALLVGYFANSPRYMRLAKAGVHGWLTSSLHGEHIPIDLPFDELSKRCKGAKSKWPGDYEKCKMVVHLSAYLGTPRRIHEEHSELFPTEREARDLQNFLLQSEPWQDVKAWQKKTVEIAHANKALENGFGLRHRFYTLYAWNVRRQVWEFGEDAKRAVAFVPQSAAAAIQRLVVHRLLTAMPEARGWLCLLVHDAVIADVPDQRVDEYCKALHQAMTAPIAELGGLSVGTELKTGVNLADMTEWVYR